MIKVSYSPAFKRAYKKAFKNNPYKKIIFQEKLDLFLLNPFHPKLRTHKLKGILKDFYAFSIEYDIRIIFYFLTDTEIVLEDIGTHDEVY